MKYKMLPLVTSLGIAFVALLWTACNKPSPFGSDLFDEDSNLFTFTDSLALRTTIQREDSVITSSTSSYYLCGELNDPIFGKSSSEIYTHLRLDNLDPGFDPSKMTFDSIVMYMHYSTTGLYGDTMQLQTLRVLRLVDPISWDGIYYSDDQLTAGAEIGRVDFMPRPRSADSLFVATSKAPYLRVKLDNSFGTELFGLDSLTTASDTAFWRALRGLKIVTSAGSAIPGSMLSFNLDEPVYSRVRLYYTVNADASHKVFDYFFNGAKKFSHYSHDYDNTLAGQKINQQSDDLLFLQSMQGLRVKVEFPTANKLDNLIVNKADLEFTVASLPGDLPAPNPLFPAQQVVLTQEQGDSTFVFTSDVLYSLGATLSEGFGRFGGYPETEVVNGMNVTRYHLSLSSVFQKMVDDKSVDVKNRTVYLSIYPQNRTPQRLIVYGPKSPIYPMKLNLKYTRLD